MIPLLARSWFRVWVLFDKGLAAPTHQAFYQPGLLLTVFALTIVSAGFHEFGHAAACRRGGATPGTMGFGLYIVFPAFYTDVSDSYRLDRRRRLWVDLGGLYFNTIFSVGAMALWVVTRWDALLLVVGLQVLQMLRQLTPSSAPTATTSWPTSPGCRTCSPTSGRRSGPSGRATGASGTHGPSSGGRVCWSCSGWP